MQEYQILPFSQTSAPLPLMSLVFDAQQTYPDDILKVLCETLVAQKYKIYLGIQCHILPTPSSRPWPAIAKGKFKIVRYRTSFNQTLSYHIHNHTFYLQD